MHAALLDAFDSSLSIRPIDAAEPAPDEVLIRTAAAGVCHSDKHGYSGGIPQLPLPTVLGHEASGVVEAVGSAVDYVRPGDHVVLCPGGSCGRCRLCDRGLPQHCVDNGRVRRDGSARLTEDGVPVNPFVGIGAFAEQMLVHQCTVARIDSRTDLTLAALLGCAVTTGIGAIRHSAQVRLGQSVAVIGCGGVGLNAIQGARLAGAARIIAVDREPAKLALATSFGATDTVDATAEEPVEAVAALTGGVDHVIEAVGSPATIQQAFAMLGTAGVATVTGLSRPGDTFTLPSIDLLAEKRIQGSRLGGTRLRLDIPLYADLYRSGDLLLDQLVGTTVRLAATEQAIAQMDTASGARTVIEFG